MSNRIYKCLEREDIRNKNKQKNTMVLISSRLRQKSFKEVSAADE